MAGDWNFTSDFVLDMTLYYRRTEHVNGAAVRTFSDPVRGANWVSAQVPAARVEAKGIEMSLYKPLSHNFSFRLSMDAGWSFYRVAGGGPRDIQTFPDSTYVASANYFLVDANDNPRPLTTQEIQILGAKANNVLSKQMKDERTEDRWLTAARPYRELPLLNDADRNRPEIQGLWYRLQWIAFPTVFVNPPPTTQASFQFLWSTPSDWGPGPKVGGSKLLGGV